MKGTLHGGSVKTGLRSMTRADKVIEKSDTAIETIPVLGMSDDMVKDSGSLREDWECREEYGMERTREFVVWTQAS